MIELQHLADQLYCLDCEHPLQLTNTVQEIRYGLASILKVECECGIVRNVTTGKTHRIGKRGPPVFDINTKAALGMLHSGSGHTQLTSFLGTLEIEGLHHTSMKLREMEVAPHVEVIAKTSCDEAIEEEIASNKETIRQYPETPTTKVQGVFKYDMGWQKRGAGRAYDSKSGIGTMFGNSTGKICAYGVRSKDCRKCTYHMKKGKTPPHHKCCKNWDGSSKAMEPDVAVAAVKEIENKNIDVSVLVMDDDATTMASVKGVLTHPVIKWSDLNHTKKKLGTSLYQLQKNHKCLSTKVILCLQKCFSYAVKQCKDKPGDLKVALQNIVPHAFGKHDECDRNWCGFHIDPEKYRHKSLPYGKNLTGESLETDLNFIFNLFISNVDKIAPAASTKDVESFNNMMASKAPKRNHYSASASLENRLNCAVAQKNKGTGYVTEVNELVGLSPGKVFGKLSDKKEAIRKRRLEVENTRDFKRKKLQTKLNKMRINTEKEIREGVTYQSGIALTNISDSSEIPAATEVPQRVPLYDLTNCYKIYCDIETTSLSKTCDIIQLAAVCENDCFNSYILPSKFISEGASQVTGLTLHGNVMFYHGNPVQTLALKECLSLFLAWLQDRNPCILIGHNFRKFDLPRLLRAFDLSKLLSNFKHTIAAVSDTYPLFVELHPELTRHNQEFLVHHFLNEEYEAHNALADVKGLKRVVEAANITDETLSKHSITAVSAVDVYMFGKKADDYVQSFSVLTRNKVLSPAMCKKAANSGLSLYHLNLSVSRGGLNGLHCLFSEKVNGKPRVTSVKKIIEKVFEFIKEQSNH